MNLQNIKKSLIVFLVSMCLYSPMALLFNLKLEFFSNRRQHAARMVQLSQHAFIRRHILANKETPKKIHDLQQSAWQFIDYFNPDAWTLPQNILLMWEHSGYYCVTFGDGSSAILTYWSPAHSEENAEKSEIKYLYSRPHFFSHGFRILIFGVIAILVTIFISNRFFEVKK